ncbi:MAG: M3 family oligoendopeptidase [Gemmatimonadaceae bacterium]|nr:M3 family oligoendopeptidase [Gemmatimonadaceae bacterium]
MPPSLPNSPADLADATWPEIAAFYDALAAAAPTRETAREWLRQWSLLEELVNEAASQALIAYTGNTADTTAEARYLRFVTEIQPNAEARQTGLAELLLATGIDDPDIAILLREFRTTVSIFRDENVARFAQIEELSAAYQKIAGGLSVEIDGKTLTIPQLQPLLESDDRAARERAFRAGADAYLSHRDAVSELFDRMYVLRQAVAQASGFSDFQAYSYAAKHRYDYTADDVARFHDAVADVVTPAAARVHAYRRERLGVDTLRPWDLAVDADGLAPLRPFSDVADFVAASSRIFQALDGELGSRFVDMARDGLLDLESRPNKAPGGYCTTLHHRKQPFVFMNAVGVSDDVTTLVHEAGHCFHAYLASHQELIWQRGTGSEAAELASMSMELLAAPLFAMPVGYYTPDQARRAQAAHLEDILLALPHIASVDAFQRWIYTSGDGHDRDARDAAWLRLRSRFEVGVDWTGLDRERTARWYRQLHIFELPFYYIEYGIAQLGALQIWKRSLTDPEGALAGYKNALRLGGTRALPDLYAAAGARLIFDAAGMRELVGLVEDRLETLRGSTVS